MAETLILSSEDLLSKWGFGDGDMPDEVRDYLDNYYPALLACEGRFWWWHDVLRGIVRSYLVPALDQHVEVANIQTIHNPIRAVKVDDVEIRSYWGDDNPSVKLTPESVEVPYAAIVEAIRDDLKATILEIFAILLCEPPTPVASPETGAR